MNIVVLGMHRSGTSLASGLLELAGVYFGTEAEMISRNDENPKGFWERRDVRALNDELLHARHADWCELSQFHDHALPEDVLDTFRSDAGQILQALQEASPTGIVGLKEPRLCLLLPEWAPLLGSDPLFILVHRDPEEIAISLHRRNGIPATVSNYLTEQYLGHSLKFLGGRPCHIVSYHEMLEDPVGALDGMVDAINRHGVEVTSPSKSAVKRLVSAKLYRSRPGDWPYEPTPKLQRWQRALDGHTLPTVRSVSPRAPKAVIAFQHDRRFTEFLRVTTEKTHLTRRVRTLESQVQSNIEFDRKVKERDARLAELRDRLSKAKSRVTELEASRERAEDLRRTLSKVETSLAAMRDERDTLASDARAKDEALAEARNALSAGERQVHDLEKEIQTFRKSLAETTAELEQALAHQEQLSGQLETALRALDERGRELASTTATLKDRTDRAEHLERELAISQARVEENELELHSLRKAIATNQHEIAELKSLLRDAQNEAEETTQDLLANEKLLNQTVQLLRGQEAQTKSLIEQAQEDASALELAEDVVGLARELQSSRSWKLIRPVLASMLHGVRFRSSSSTLPDLATRAEQFRTALHNRAPARAGALRSAGISLASKSRRKIPATALVVTWDVGHNPLGRSYMLAEVLQRVFRNVIIVGFGFPRFGQSVWEPLRNSAIPVIDLPGRNFPDFLQDLERISNRIEPDIVFACKTRLPSVQLGAMMKRRLGCPLVLDIDDHELTFFRDCEEIAPDELERMPVGAARQELEPYDAFWTGVAQGMRAFADECLVSNVALQNEFGGVVVPHVRDETVFDASIYSKKLVRHEFGVPQDSKVILFLGTPRRHKGIDLLARAVAGHDHERTRLVVVGDVPDAGDLARLVDIAGDRLITIGNQPFDRIPAILSMADAVCLPQDPTHPTCAFQLPAKAIDAIAMGVPLLVTRTPPLIPLIDSGLATEVNENNLASVLGEVLDACGDTADQCRRSRELFLRQYSYAAAADTLHELCTSLFEDAVTDTTFDSDLERFLAAQRRTLGIESTETRASIQGGRDIVLFWKQNDSGLYGRRVDMFIKYLESRPDVRRIVVFDAPISEYDLLNMRGDTDRPTQHRWIYRRTYEKALGKLDTEKVSYNVFHHPPGLYDLPGRSTPGRRPLTEGYLPFIERVLLRESVEAEQSLFVLYPKNYLGREIIEHFNPGRVLVDVVDDHREWPGTTPEEYDRLTRNYEELLDRADMAFVNCRPMLDKMTEFSGNLRLVENGCDAHPPEQASPHDDALSGLRAWGGKVIGFVGNLEKKIDLELIRKVIHRFRDARIVLIGSTHSNEDAAELGRLENVLMPGVVPYDEIAAWVRRFDIAIVPHVRSGMTEHMNPLKIYVYLQHGVPVVSTNVHNIGYRGPLLRIADDHDAFLDAVQSCLDRPTGELRLERDRFIAENEWSRRFGPHVDELLGGPKENLETPRKAAVQH